MQVYPEMPCIDFHISVARANGFRSTLHLPYNDLHHSSLILCIPRPVAHRLIVLSNDPDS